MKLAKRFITALVIIIETILYTSVLLSFKYEGLGSVATLQDRIDLSGAYTYLQSLCPVYHFT